MEIVAQIVMNAVIAGAIYALIALGFNLLYSTTKFFDLGYGAIAAVGAYATLYFYQILNVPLVLAMLLSIVLAAVLGVLIEFFIYQPLRARKSSNTVLLIASLGVLTSVQAIIAMIFSSQFRTLSKDVSSEKVFTVLGGTITETQVLILLAGLVILVALALLLRFTFFGKAVRAISDDEEVANIIGINSKKVLLIVCLISYAIAACAGIGIGFDTGIQPTMGLTLLLKGVVASIVGGVGNIYGGVLGAFLLAGIENVGAWQFSGEWKDAIAFVVLIIFLLFRPQGILGKK